MDVLVVEDDFDIRYILNYEISGLGFNPICFSTPVEAQEYLRQHSVDAVVCDYRMPEMDGIEFFNWMKGTTEQVPFILMTGEAHMDEASLLERGVRSVLHKPQELRNLRDILNKISSGLLG